MPNLRTTDDLGMVADLCGRRVMCSRWKSILAVSSSIPFSLRASAVDDACATAPSLIRRSMLSWMTSEQQVRPLSTTVEATEHCVGDVADTGLQRQQRVRRQSAGAYLVGEEVHDVAGQSPRSLRPMGWQCGAVVALPHLLGDVRQMNGDLIRAAVVDLLAGCRLGLIGHAQAMPSISASSRSVWVETDAPVRRLIVKSAPAERLSRIRSASAGDDGLRCRRTGEAADGDSIGGVDELHRLIGRHDFRRERRVADPS